MPFTPMVGVSFLAHPPTSFPLRDLLVLEQLELGAGETVAELGIGSGGTTARIAQLCARVVGFEISSRTVETLRYLEERHPNLELVQADVTDPVSLGPWAGKFTRVIACDTLEHVVDPAAFFRGVAKLLAPGGRFLVTFPNEPAEVMHGVTRFDDVASLQALVEDAGLDDCHIVAARLSSRAREVADRFGWAPLNMVRRIVRGPAAPKPQTAAGSTRPQVFDETDFMSRMPMWKRLSPLVNLYWFGVLRLMQRTGRCFDVDPDFRTVDFRRCQVLVTGRLRSGGSS